MPAPKVPKPPRFEVDHISFSLKLIKAHIPIKFKCRFLVQLKTSSTTSSLKTLAKSKDHYRQVASVISFDSDEILQFGQYMVFDNELNRYKKSQMQIVVSLISDNRGDEVKLVGRIRVDLNEFMIDNRGETLLKEQQLENCSVKKPQVAKLVYELRLVQQQKMNIAQNVDKQTIFAEIDRGLFSDALEYNQFGKEVFGKDFSLINASKLTKSFNDSISRGNNGSREDVEADNKVEKGDKLSTKEILNSSVKLIEEKIPIIQPKQTQKKQESILASSKQVEISKDNKNQQLANNAKDFDKKIISEQQSVQQDNRQQKIVQQAIVSQKPQQPQPFYSFKSIPPKVISSITTKSPAKNVASSPKSKPYQPVSDQITQVQPSSEQKNRNFLTQSMFDEQQMVIESLQDQLQEANEMIEQYRLEMELLKQEAERLQDEKSMHASELQTSRLRNQSSSSGFMLQPTSPQSNQLEHQVLSLTLELQEYKKVFTQKEQIISQKDHIILLLQKEIQSAAQDMIEQLNEKDMALNQLDKQYTLILQENHQIKGEINKLMQQNTMKSQEANQMQGVIEQLKKEVVKLDNMVKNSEITELNAQLTQKDHHIKQIQDLLELQQINTSQLQLKVTSLELTISSLTKSLQQHTQKLTKAQQTVKKHHQAKQKAQHEMSKAIQKAKTIEKQKYQLTQEITNNKANQKSIDKLVQQKVKQYKLQYDDLALTYEEAQNKIAQLKFALQSYQSTLESQQEKSQEQIRELTGKLENFNKKEHLLRQSLDLLENQTNKIRNFVQQKETKIRQYEELVFMKDEELNEKNDKINFMERKHRMTENAINDLKLELKMANAMNLQSQDDRPIGTEEQLETRLFILNEANMQLLQKQKILTENLDQKEQAIHDLQKLTSTIDPLKRQIISLEQKLSTSEQKILELKEEAKVLYKKQLEQRTQIDQQSFELEYASNQCQQLQEQVTSLEEEKLMMLTIIGEYKEKDLERVNSEHTDKIKTLGLEIFTKNEELTNLKRQLVEMERTNYEMNKKISLIESNNAIQNLKKDDLLTHSRKLSQDKEPLSAIKQMSHKDSSSTPQHLRSKEEQEIYRLTEELQAYKQREESYMCNVLDLQQQLQIVKKEKLSLSSSIHEKNQSLRKSQSLQPTAQYGRKDLKIACDQLEKLIEERIKNRDTENLIQMIVSNSEVLGSESRVTNEEGTLFAKQKNSLQEKSRILSREVQKIKSLIFKNSEFSYKSKTEIIQLLKPCENITNELVKIAQNFSKENDEENFSEA